MNFYVLNNNRFDDSEYSYGEKADQKSGEFEKCEICGAAISMREWLPPLKVKLSKPSYGDLVFGTFSNFLASNRFLNKFNESGLTGIDYFRQVEIVKVNRKRITSPEPPQYYYCIITRSKAKIDEKLSVFIREGDIKCDICRAGGIIKSFKGVYLESGTWNGEDIFYPVGLPGTIIVTEKFIQFVEQNGFTNINFVPAEQYMAPWVK